MAVNVLAVVAHPDDEVLGCGGTLARHARQGDECRVLFLGQGAFSRKSPGESSADAEKEVLTKAAEKAASVLGVTSIHFEDYPDNRMDSVDLLDVIKKVEGWISRYEPALVYTHSPVDLNIDHVIAARAVVTATRPLVGCPVQSVYGFETPSSTEWSFARAGDVFKPDTFVDIHETLDQKLAVMEAYVSEIRDFPHPRSLKGIASLARWRGSQCGLKAAEGFSTFRRICGPDRELEL